MRIVRPLNLSFHLVLTVILAGTLAIIAARVVGWGAWLGAAAFVLGVAASLRQPWRRWQAARHPFPEAWRDWLATQVPLFAALDSDGRTRFEQDVQLYLAEQRFEAVADVAVTDTLRLAVAAGAALMLHGRPDWEISTRRTVLFYPGRFDEDYADTRYADYDGMVHSQGPVILAADAVLAGWADAQDGSNVVLHELAHLFDFERAYADGTPSLMDPVSAQAWADLVAQEIRRIRQGRSILRRYAATNAAEFFAVSVEVFFERPQALYQAHRALYHALAAFFNLDPLEVLGKQAGI